MGRNQKQLADQIAKEMGLTLRQGREFLSRLLELVREDLVTTERCELRGLGTFAVYARPARKTTHPVTGEPVKIPARRGIRYRTSKQLKEMLNTKPTRKKAAPKAKKGE